MVFHGTAVRLTVKQDISIGTYESYPVVVCAQTFKIIEPLTAHTSCCKICLYFELVVLNLVEISVEKTEDKHKTGN